jgi:mediator of RNA polymerase II transcription subunit 14
LKLSEVLPSKNRSPRTGKQWANDIIKLTFLGLDTIPAPSTSSKPASELPTPVVQTPALVQSKPGIADERAVMVTEARIVIPDRESLSVLQENFDQDIAFDKKTGSFAIRLRSAVGEPIIRALVENFNRIEHFVDFINVLDKHKDSLHSETTSLGKLVFTYGPQGTGNTRPYQATVNFGAVNSSMTIDFDGGNPHLRIQDYLTRVLNDKQGLDGVASLLPLTLPALRALDSIEAQWLKLPDKGEALIFVRAVEWYIVRYNMILSPAADGSSGPTTRKIMFEIKLQHRKAEPWWYIRRTDTRDKDEIDMALKPIWDSTGNGWRGMRVSAVAEPRGAEELLGKVDQVLRTVVLSNPPQQQQQAQPASAPPLPVPVAPVAQMQRTASKGPNRLQIHNQNQQQRQQPTPNQSQNNSQNQSQGRNGPPMKREIVEIDSDD